LTNVQSYIFEKVQTLSFKFKFHLNPFISAAKIQKQISYTFHQLGPNSDAAHLSLLFSKPHQTSPFGHSGPASISLCLTTGPTKPPFSFLGEQKQLPPPSAGLVSPRLLISGRLLRLEAKHRPAPTLPLQE
jgi:hypothetical protein